jgi:protein-tyrosine phosphatase
MNAWGAGYSHRDLDWDGCSNVRDFGGLPMAGGGTTPMGRLVRGDSPEQLSAAGWAALRAFGVRTVIDIRRAQEAVPGALRARGLDLHRVSWNDYPDSAWNERHEPPGLPSSMRAFLRDYPEAIADTARLVLGSSPGAVMVHCAVGRDRTGLFMIVLGALVGVDAQALYDDYRYSFSRLVPSLRKLGRQDEIDFLESDAQAERRARAFGEARSVIDELDSAAAERVLLAGGLVEQQIKALRTRLVG